MQPLLPPLLLYMRVDGRFCYASVLLYCYTTVLLYTPLTVAIFITLLHPTTQANRRAPHLSFAGEGLGYSAPSTAAGAAVSLSSLATRFTPSNEFEAALAGALAASGMGALPGQMLHGKRGERTRVQSQLRVRSLIEKKELALVLRPTT